LGRSSLKRARNGEKRKRRARYFLGKGRKKEKKSAAVLGGGRERKVSHPLFRGGGVGKEEKKSLNLLQKQMMPSAEEKASL